MKKMLFFMLFTSVCMGSKAQKGNNQVQAIAEIGIIPFSNYNTGLGGYAKGLFGMGKSGQLTLTLGISKFTENFNENTATTGNIIRLVPFLAGYRKNISKFYVEPQVGYGEYGGKIKLVGGGFAKPSEGAFFWGIGLGYCSKRIDAGIRFENANTPEKTLFLHRTFNFLGIHIGYNILKKK